MAVEKQELGTVVRVIFFFALVVYLVTAYNSHGFHHYDEHFQIIEFAGLKLGINQPTDLAWEFGAQIRCSIQPWLAFLFLKGLGAVGIDEPITQMQIVRCTSAIFLFGCLVLLFNSFRDKFSQKWQNAFCLMTLLFFISPYIVARFSSETWGTAFFILAIVSYREMKSNHRIKWVLIGVFIGLSFLFRLQMAFMIIGFIGWCTLIEKLSVKQLGIMMVGGVATVLFGVFLDYLFYGNWVFTPWNYFSVNLIQNKAASFGVEPWYYYVQKMGHYKVFSLLTVTCCVFVFIHFIRNPKSFFTWTLVPFLLGHFFIGHKEMRFLYPVFLLVSYPIVDTSAYLFDQLKSTWLRRGVLLYLIFLIMLNTAGLFRYLLKPADFQVLMYDRIAKDFPNRKLYYVPNEYGFFAKGSDLPINYYSRWPWNPSPLGMEEIAELERGDIVIAERDSFLSRHASSFEVYEISEGLYHRFNVNNWMKVKHNSWVIFEKTADK